MSRETALKMVSFGIVAANKPLRSKDIEVAPMEHLPMLNGELTDNLATQNASGQDADGASFQTTVKTSATLTATWLPQSSNRLTAPDVRRGEKVKIWQFGDADKYYWSDLDYDGKLRKLETLKMGISATQDESAEPSDDNMYTINLSSHEKLVHLHTSTSDGEPFGYDIIINTKDGSWQITDTAENSVFVSSSDNRIVLTNGDGTSLDLNGEDCFLNVVGDFGMKVGGDMTTEVTGKYSLKSEGDYLVDAPKVDFVTPQFTTSEKFECGDMATVGADAIVNGGLQLGAGMKTGVGGGGGDININGGLSLNGAISSSSGAKFSASVIAPNIK